MAQFSTNVITPAYWADSAGFKSGRDSMGHQNSSFVVYANLVPGITNLTQRIRYYGFYCWLLTEYEALKENQSSAEQQKNFVRRAELTLAFLMQQVAPEYIAIPGSDFAAEFIDQLKSAGSFDISLGADLGKGFINGAGLSRNYWKAKGGALAQYYAGALTALALVGYEFKYFIPTDKCRRLAEAYGGSIPRDAQDTFLRILNTGILRYSDLEALRTFDLSLIQPETEEWNAYLDLMLAADSPEKQKYMRKSTILDYLQLCDEGVEQNRWMLGEFYFDHPERVDFSPDSASLGWYLYYCLELEHHATEHLFSQMLLDIKKEVLHLKEFTDAQVRAFETHFAAHDLTVSDYLSQSTFAPPIDISLQLNDAAYNTDFDIVRNLAVELLFATYKQFQPHLEAFHTFIRQNQLGTQHGSLHELDAYIQTRSSKTMSAFYADLIRKILNDHQEVAYFKMGNKEAMVHKFVIEHNHLVHVGDIMPSFTTPRHGAVKKLLEDLSLLDKEHHIPSDLGRNLLLLNGYRS